MLPKSGILLLVLWAQGLAREPFQPSDLWAWHSAEAPRIDAQAKWVVYVERRNDRAADAAYANLWLASTDGRQHLAITPGSWRDTRPRWSPDGLSIAYLSDRAGAPHIRIHRIDSGSDTPLSTAGLRPLTVGWSPDGKALAFTAIQPSRASVPWAPAAILPLLQPTPDAVQVFLVAAEGGAPRQLTHAPLAVRGEPVWMPQGDWVLTAAGAPGETEIYGVRVSDGEVRQLSHHPGPDEHLLPSPDGSKIAWIGAEPTPAAYAIRKLWVMGRDGEHVKVLTGQLDRDVMCPQWSSDSRTLYFLADDHGSTHVYAARNDGTVRTVTRRDERLRGLSLADNGRAVTVRSTANESGEVVSFAVDLPGGVTPLAAPNQHLLAERDLGATEAIHYESAGQSIEGWLTKPPRFDPARQYPLLLDLHDAPRAMCGVEFQLRAQIFAARGFAVLCVDARGTPGYGENFGNLLRTRFPGDDFEDLMRGVDYAVGRGGIDPQRLTVSGGLLAAWAIGHTDRFAAAVSRRPIVDWTAEVTLAEDSYRRAGWMGALPWEDPDQYVKHSPLYFAQNFKTPTLVIAGADDPQSRELYFALQARKVDTALVRLADEGQPSARVLELEATLAWLARRAIPAEAGAAR